MPSYNIDPNVSVLIGIPHVQLMQADFVKTMVAMKKPPEARYMWQGQTTLIDVARNNFAEASLQAGFSHLFMMDSDQTFPDFALLQLLSRDLDIVTGIYPQRDFFLKPVIYREKKDKIEGSNNYEHILEWDENGGPFEVDACGTGCMLIKTDVFRELGAPYFLASDSNKGGYMGEDIFFCQKAREAGFKIYADPKVKCGHLETKELTVDEFIQQRDQRIDHRGKSENFKVKCLYCQHEFTDSMSGDLLYAYKTNPNMAPPVVTCPECNEDQPFFEIDDPLREEFQKQIKG